MPDHVREYQRGQRQRVAAFIHSQIQSGLSLIQAIQAPVPSHIQSAIESGAQRRSSRNPSRSTLKRWYYEFYPPQDRRSVGLKLRAEGKTQREVAQALGVSIRTVRNWERT